VAQLALPLAGAVMYGLRARTLRRRGTPVPAWRIASFAGALVLFAVALSPPLDYRAGELFSFHMIQHVLLGDLAPLLFVLGLTGPLLRPLLALRPVAALRFLAHPLVALPLWTLNLYLWHLPYLYEAAVRHDGIHALEHLCFFTAGSLMWAAVIEVLPGPAWFGTAAKLGYIVAVRLLETILGNVFIWTSSPIYDVYDDGSRLYGLSPVRDQALAGTVMMIEGSLVTLGAIAWLFLRWGAESELRQQLVEQGVDPRVASRAVRYGRGKELQHRR
jgi:cytochrome c oxidase assembly factor CtaG